MKTADDQKWVAVWKSDRSAGVLAGWLGVRPRRRGTRQNVSRLPDRRRGRRRASRRDGSAPKSILIDQRLVKFNIDMRHAAARVDAENLLLFNRLWRAGAAISRRTVGGARE